MQLVWVWLQSVLIFSFRQLNSSPAFLSTFWEGRNRDLVNRGMYQLADREVLIVAMFRAKYLQAVECNTLPPVVVHSWCSTATLLQDCKHRFWPFMCILGKISILFNVYVFFRF